MPLSFLVPLWAKDKQNRMKRLCSIHDLSGISAVDWLVPEGCAGIIFRRDLSAAGLPVPARHLQRCGGGVADDLAAIARPAQHGGGGSIPAAGPRRDSVGSLQAS